MGIKFHLEKSVNFVRCTIEKKLSFAANCKSSIFDCVFQYKIVAKLSPSGQSQPNLAVGPKSGIIITVDMDTFSPKVMNHLTF